jgi:simple sugar transport system permease protein
VSETAQRTPATAGEPPTPPTPAMRAWERARQGGVMLARQREVTVFVVVVLLIVYFGFISSAGRPVFFGRVNLVNLTQIAAPIIIIACGEVLLLICGEIDLSPGFVYLFVPFLMHYLIDFYGVPGIPAILLSLLFAAFVGWFNGFLTIRLGLPSFIATLGTGFVLWGLTLTTSNAEQAAIPNAVQGIGHYIGEDAWAEIIWALIFVVIFHIVLTRTRWGLHTIAVGGNQLGAREAGINVARIKYGNFMITALLGGFVGLQIAFQTSIIDPSAGQFLPMFYSVAAAVIGGTAMLGGSGTMIGAFLGSLLLAVLFDGFDVIGISANPLNMIIGGAILAAMIVNVALARLQRRGRV